MTITLRLKCLFGKAGALKKSGDLSSRLTDASHFGDVSEMDVSRRSTRWW